MESLFVSKPAASIAPSFPFRLSSYSCHCTPKLSSFKSTASSYKTPSFITVTCSAPTVVRRRPDYIPNHIPDPKYVRIFDTTLRDGEQAAGAAMTGEQKLEIAQQLAKLGVDIIEAGFPAASKDEFEAVKMIAKEVGNNIDETGYVPVICGLARCIVKDIDASWEAVKYAKRPRVHTFIATSEIHMKYKLEKSREEIIEMARSMVSYARSLGCDDVEFSPEDAARSDREFLYKILGEVIKAGATTLNIPDTVGNTHPRIFGPLIADIKANTEGIDNVIISTHCHNDYGLAVINTEEGMCAGARQVEVTINGIGERGGNAPLEELVMGSKAHGNDVLGGLYTGIVTKHILMTSKMVERYSQFKLQPHKPIVGVNAFAHGSGIHQDGMLKNKGTYEIMNPEDIGLFRANESGLVLGKHSGRHAVESQLFELGYTFDGKELDDVFWRFKAVAEKKKCITDDDLIALMDESFQSQAIWTLGDIEVVCGTVGVSRAKIKLIAPDKKTHVASSTGTGPVDSAFKAINLIVKEAVTLQEYSLNAVTEGIDAIATTRVLIHADQTPQTSTLGGATPPTFSGTGASRDVVVSSVRAYITSLNKYLRLKNKALES